MSCILRIATFCVDFYEEFLFLHPLTKLAAAGLDIDAARVLLSNPLGCEPVIGEHEFRDRLH